MKKMKRYQEGGEAEGLSGTAGRMSGNKKPRTIDDMTFGQAFKTKLDELGEGKTFTWRGKKYTTDTKKPAAKPAAKVDDAPATGRSVAFEESRDVTPAREKSPAPKKTITGALAATSGTAGQRKRGAKEGYKSGDFMRAIRARFGTQRMRDELADEFGSAEKRGESVAMRRIREQRMRSQGMKKGGAVHKMPDGTMMKGKSHKGYNKGGKIDGCAVRGKTRGRMC